MTQREQALIQRKESVIRCNEALKPRETALSSSEEAFLRHEKAFLQRIGALTQLKTVSLSREEDIEQEELTPGEVQVNSPSRSGPVVHDDIAARPPSTDTAALVAIESDFKILWPFRRT